MTRLEKISTPIPLWKRIVFLSFPLIGVICCLEVWLRLFGYSPLQLPKPGTSPQGYFWICDQSMGFRNRPNGQYRYDAMQANPLVTTDEYGYRNGVGWKTQGDSPIIAFIGDSTTFCAEVNDDQTGPSEVAKLLTPKFRWRVLNAGVRGYTALFTCV